MKAVLAALGVSLAAHGGLYLVMPHEGRTASAPRPVQISIEVLPLPAVNRPPPSPAPARALPHRVARAPVAKPKPPPPPAPVEAPPPPQAGIDEHSTVAESSFVVPAGETLLAEPPRVAQEPRPVAPAAPARPADYVAPAQVSALPEVLEEVVAPYPREAREAGVTGEVLAVLLIDDRGQVLEARKIAGPGHGLDDAALAALLHFRFRPARLNGVDVATSIRYAYNFRIE